MKRMGDGSVYKCVKGAGSKIRRILLTILFSFVGSAILLLSAPEAYADGKGSAEANENTASDEQPPAYDLNIADALLRLEKRNPFAFAPMDKGYVTFIFDDLTGDVDLIASVFAEYGYPVVLAAIPKKLDRTAKGLTAARGNYTVGMTMREVMTQVVLDGGEIMMHNGSVVTADNQYDYAFMYNYFVSGKATLEAAGFHPRGIIRSGGKGAISRSAEIDRWLIGNYEYANMGTLPQYAWKRKDSGEGFSAMKTAIDTAASNHTWVSFTCHGLDAYSFGEALSDESKLREMLTYCQTAGVRVVTCGYIFDHFGSSVLAELMAGR